MGLNFDDPLSKSIRSGRFLVALFAYLFQRCHCFPTIFLFLKLTSICTSFHGWHSMDQTHAVSAHNAKLEVGLDRLTELHHVDTYRYLATSTLSRSCVPYSDICYSNLLYLERQHRMIIPDDVVTLTTLERLPGYHNGYALNEWNLHN